MADQSPPVFADRQEAGRLLAGRLEQFRATDSVVLGLPRGGVPVAFEVAMELDLPLDVIVVRKIGAPSQPEFALGATAEGGVRSVDTGIASRFGMTRGELARLEERERAEVAARVALFRGDAPLDLTGTTALVVDDGIATGASARVACGVARARGARRVVLAVPVAPGGFAAGDATADDLVTVLGPTDMWAVGRFYRDFTQTPSSTVVDLLARARQR